MARVGGVVRWDEIALNERRWCQEIVCEFQSTDNNCQGHVCKRIGQNNIIKPTEEFEEWLPDVHFLKRVFTQ